jgi:molecular chaperone DnaK
MMDEAAANAESDKKKRELVDAKNTADTSVFAIEKSLKEHADKLDDATKKTIEDAKKALQDEIANPDATAESLKTKTDALNEAAMKLGEIVYKAAQEAAAKGQGGAPSDKKPDDATDADFEEKK